MRNNCTGEHVNLVVVNGGNPGVMAGKRWEWQKKEADMGLRNG